MRIQLVSVCVCLHVFVSILNMYKLFDFIKRSNVLLSQLLFSILFSPFQIKKKLRARFFASHFHLIHSSRFFFARQMNSFKVYYI